MSVYAKTSKSPSIEEMNAALERSRRVLDLYHKDNQSETSKKVSFEASFLSGIFRGISIASTVVRIFDTFKGFWSTKNVSSLAPVMMSAGDSEGTAAGDRDLSAPENPCNDFSRERDNFSTSDWSRDIRWQEAEWQRHVGDVYNNGFYERTDESLSLFFNERRPFEARDQFYAAISDALTASGRYSEANRIENQIAQDAAQAYLDRARSESGDGIPCVIL